MKGDSVVNNIEDIFMSNESMDRKIKFLETEKIKREAYIKDLQQSLSLNKESISALASSLSQTAVYKLNQQNEILHQELKRQYDENLNNRALLLIEQQLRIEEKKIYNERLVQFENNMSELRKYLQDKEDSFSAIVVRLKKYEDLNQVSLSTKLDRFQKEFKDDPVTKIIEELTEERDKYKNIWSGIELQLEDLGFLKFCFEDKKTYEEMKEAYKLQLLDGRQQKTEKVMQLYEKNQTAATMTTKIDQKLQPNRQLVKLLKKEKVNNEILQEALSEAIEKNQELIIENNSLVESNANYQMKIERMQSKAYLLQQELAQFEKNLQRKRLFKFKCDLDKPGNEQASKIQMKGDEGNQHMESLKLDMQRLSSFIITCVPRGKLVKSSSAPNLQADELDDEMFPEDQVQQNNAEMQEDELQIEEI